MSIAKTALEVTEVKRSLAAVLAIIMSMLTACAPGPPTSTVTESSTPAETPALPTTSPVPTVSGASGPLGVVQANQTWIDASTGLSVTIEQVTTAPLPGAKVRSSWDIYAQMFGLRVAVDTTGAIFRGVTLDAWPPIGLASGFWLLSSDQMHDADCDTLTFDLSDVEQRQALAAIDGDTAFQFDTQSGRGDGWIMCGVFPEDAASFTTGFTVIFDATAAHTADGNRVGSPPLAVVAVAP